MSDQVSAVPAGPLAARAQAFIVASLLTAYPENVFLPLLSELLESDDIWEDCVNVDPESWAHIAEHLDHACKSKTALDDLRSSYIDIFDRSREANPPYETEYGRERAMLKATQLADIAGFYKAFGFLPMTTEGHRDMLDHAAVELEFYSLLLLKTACLMDRDAEGESIVKEARSKFMDEHLGTFISAIAHRPGVVRDPFYGAVYTWASALVYHEASELGVTPKETSWVKGQEPGEISCCPGEGLRQKTMT